MKTIELSNSTKTAKVDDDDFGLLSRFNWYLTDSGYAMTQLRGQKHIKMHHLVYGSMKGGKYVIDHINRDRLDNRKANLRCVTQRENTRNSERVDSAKGYYYSNSPCHHNRHWIVECQGVANTFATEEEAKEAVGKIKNGTFVKRKDLIHETCPRCGEKKMFYGSVWTCRKCSLRRMKEYYQRKKEVKHG